jgi:phosphoribosyl-ATP pyrophosphohydrolase
MSVTPFQSGYHLVPITKGELGTVSKIREELDELTDAVNQDAQILVLVEASDLYLALEGMVVQWGSTMDEVAKMAAITRRAFEAGQRT